MGLISTTLCWRWLKSALNGFAVWGIQFNTFANYQPIINKISTAVNHKKAVCNLVRLNMQEKRLRLDFVLKIEDYARLQFDTMSTVIISLFLSLLGHPGIA